VDKRPQYLVIGEVLRPHGVQGELRIRILTDYPERIAELQTVYLGAGVDSPTLKPYPVEGMRMHQNYGLLKLRGINSRNQADRLRDLFIMVDMEHAVPLEEGEFYVFELLGLEVRTVEGDSLGTITEVIETGANDVYVVDSPRYGEVLIPVTEETVLQTDIAARILTVRLPEGLLPSQNQA
jgi:16S rRNA processing protein RimM